MHAPATQMPAHSQATVHTESYVLLHRLKAAEEERDSLRVEVQQLRLKCAAADLVHIQVQVVEEVKLEINVQQERSSVWNAQLASERLPDGCSTVQISAPPSKQLPSEAGRRLTANGMRRVFPSPQQQCSTAQQPSGSEWVFAGLPFAAGSSRDAAHAAAADFAAQQLSMPDAAQRLTVLRVSGQRDGLAVVKLADRATERSLCNAKALLPRDCGVSIFRSLPPEQRAAAALLRQTQRQAALLTAADVAEARRAAKAALDFARQRTFERRTSYTPSAFRPLHAFTPIGIPSFYSVLHDEAASDASPDANTLTEGSTPPPAEAPAAKLAPPTAVCIDAR